MAKLAPDPKLMTAQALVPHHASLAEVRSAASVCKACDLWKNATQTVFGEGKPRGSVMLVGEQPGDREDLAGKPFVGPAGRLLDEALAEAGIDREEVYVTNIGKHFRWVMRERGKLMKSDLAPQIMATVHPSSVLRAPDDAARHQEKMRFIDDLKKVGQLLRRRAKAA